MIPYTEPIEVTFEIEGVVVKGNITELSDFYIEVEITSPYCNWKNSLHTTGPGRQYSKSYFLRYEELAESLLTQSFRKLKFIDEGFDRHVNVYTNLENELALVDQLPDSAVKTTIKSKLSDWFFQYYLFTPSVTKLCTAISEEPIIKNYIMHFRKTKKKLFIPKGK